MLPSVLYSDDIDSVAFKVIELLVVDVNSRGVIDVSELNVLDLVVVTGGTFVDAYSVVDSVVVSMGHVS